MSQDARQAAEWRLIEKAWKDDGFRSELLADPNGAVSRELGVELPSGMNVRVVEETADTFVLVIPARGEEAGSGRLSVSELEQVAGGWDTSSLTCASCTCSGGGCK